MKNPTRVWIVLLGAAIVLAASVSMSVPPEDGPMFLTDTHGASGVAHALLELSTVYPEYDRYWKGALDWLISVAERDERGRMTWRFSASAPEGHPNRRINLPGVCHIIRMFVEGYRRTGDERYKEATIAGVRWLTEVAMLKRKTRLGLGCGWSHSYRPGDTSLGLLAGHSHGLGNFISTMIEAYSIEPDKRLETVLKGILINLRLRGKTIVRDGKVMFAFPKRNNDRIFETGYCYGQAGIAVPLYDLAREFADMKLSDGTTPLSMANANLRYLMDVAVRYGDGYVWPYMRHEKRSMNIGYGSGTGGIGWAFLKGFEANAGSDPAFAEECMRYARGAAEFAVELIMRIPETEPFPQPGGAAGFGVCGGSSGGCHFLMLFASKIREKDPEFARRIDAAIERIGKRLIVTARDTGGTLVWMRDERTVNMALDYGQTGVVLALTKIGRYLKNREFLEAARKGADFVAKQAVPENGGYKFPLRVAISD